MCYSEHLVEMVKIDLSPTVLDHTALKIFYYIFLYISFYRWSYVFDSLYLKMYYLSPFSSLPTHSMQVVPSICFQCTSKDYLKINLFKVKYLYVCCLYLFKCELQLVKLETRKM